MTDRAAYYSSRLIFPVASPWALARRGNPTAYLSVRQRALLLYLGRSQKRGRRTLEEIGRLLDVTSRGQVSRELRRLRQLDLIGYSAVRGSKGSHRLWLSRRAARLRFLRSARQRANDSASTPFGGYLSRKGLESAWRRRRHPPGAGLASARDGPRRGQGPPRTLNARCPVGHQTRLGRRSWRSEPGGALEAAFHGVCRPCGRREIVEIVSVRPPAPPPREFPPGTDPAYVDRLLRQAAAFEAEGLELRLVREYRDMAQRSLAAADQVNGVVHESASDLARIVHEIRPD